MQRFAITPMINNNSWQLLSMYCMHCCDCYSPFSIFDILIPIGLERLVLEFQNQSFPQFFSKNFFPLSLQPGILSLLWFWTFAQPKKLYLFQRCYSLLSFKIFSLECFTHSHFSFCSYSLEDSSLSLSAQLESFPRKPLFLSSPPINSHTQIRPIS